MTSQCARKRLSRLAHTPRFLLCVPCEKWNPRVLATECSLFIHLLQQALVILLIECVLGVKHVGCAELLQSSP